MKRPRHAFCPHLLWLGLFPILFTGCATIAHGPLQKFVITADPKVASIYIDGRYFGKTPAVVRMKRSHSHTLLLKLDGYQPYELKLKRKLDGWAFGNLAVGGVPGIAIDLLSGSIFRLTPKDIYPTLTASTRRGDESVAVLITLTPQTHWERIGRLATAGIGTSYQ
jgi:PEGA domain-containing protein